ncbi:hypothetical protein [Winogradskyella sp.]|uniref:hypothetical protein n=1 Tax=Winogradskyella sp. TaxID=1883156 RepID=UPI00260CD2A6|nr:hypothetical protein [Winogradskyella sp.]
MKTLKITLALVAIAMLTVSGVQSEKAVNDKPTYETKSNFDVLAINKKKRAVEQQA